MTIFRITPDASLHTTADVDHAFKLDSAGADTLDVDPGAFMNTEGFAAAGALLANTGAWTVTVDGSIVSRQAEGIVLASGNTAVSTITVGAEGEVSGYRDGITVGSAATIENFGMITAAATGNGTGIYLAGAGPHTITNAGTINAVYAVYSYGPGNVRVTNSGTLNGVVALDEGTNVILNTGAINGYVSGGDGFDRVINSGLMAENVDLDAGADVFTNFRTVGDTVINGTVIGTIYLGDGDDRFEGGARTETVRDDDGADSVKLGGGRDTYLAEGNEGADGIDTIYGGESIDTYDARDALSGVSINLDTVTHDLSPVVPGAGRLGGRIATGADIAGTGRDRVIEFENAIGGAAGDTIYGSGAANALDGAGGNDFLFGFGDNDTLIGGAGFDNLVGGAGRDTLTGGAQADAFVFALASDSGTTSATRDLITDFEDVSDVIALDAIDAIAGTAANDAFAFIGTSVRFGGVAGELRAYLTATGLTVEGDVNGDRRADFSIALADADHSVVLTSVDFVL